MYIHPSEASYPTSYSEGDGSSELFEDQPEGYERGIVYGYGDTECNIVIGENGRHSGSGRVREKMIG